MNKKNKLISNFNKHNTLLLKFNTDSDSEVESWLGNFNLEFFKVSSLIQRWAVEVPFWKEEEYIQKFFKCSMVESILRTPRYKRQEFDDEE